MVLNNLGGLAYWGGRWDEAVGLYRKAGAASERAGRPADVAYTDCNVGEILSDQGQLDEAADHLGRARRIWTGTGERQAVAYLDVLVGRLLVRRGESDQAIPILEAAKDDLGKFKIDAYADFAQALIAEAEAFTGDAMRALEIASRALQEQDRLRPMLTRAAGIALVRLGENKAALRELTHALRSARDRGSEYDVAATIDALDAIGGADADLRTERDEILNRLRIRKLLTPTLNLVG
jgi:tetratricopeptide (TPR) repeat protein